MKRSLLKIILAMLLVFAVFMAAGCDLFGEETPPPEVALEDLVGSWKGTTESGNVKKYNFTKDMKYTLNESKGGGDIFSSGTFTLEGNILTLTPFETMAKPTVHEISEFETDRMVWGKGSVTVEYTREGKKK